MDYKDYNFGNLQYPCSCTKTVNDTGHRNESTLRKIYRMMGNYQPSPSNKLWFSTAKKLIINEEENTEKNLEFQIGIEPSTFRTQKNINVKTKNRSKWMLEVKHPCKRVQINKSDVFFFKAPVRIKTFLLPVIEANCTRFSPKPVRRQKEYAKKCSVSLRDAWKKKGKPFLRDCSLRWKEVIIVFGEAC